VEQSWSKTEQHNCREGENYMIRDAIETGLSIGIVVGIIILCVAVAFTVAAFIVKYWEVFL
jgi:hypothetical protein